MASDERLLEFLYLLPMGLVEFEQDGSVGIMNPAIVNLLLPIAGPDATRNAFDLLSPLVPDLAELTQNSSDAGVLVSSRGRLRDPRGDVVVVEVTVHRVVDRFVALVRDVTAQAEAQRRLRREEARLEALVRSVKGYGLCSVDPEGVIDTWNEAAARIFGVENAIGRRLDEVVPMEAALTSVLHAAATTGWQRVTARVDDPRGGERWLQTLISPIEGDGDAAGPEGFAVVARDITEDRRHAEELEEAAFTDPLTGLLNRRGFDDRYADMTETGPDVGAVLMVDLDHFKDVNDTHGHDVGDRVLQAVADALNRSVRSEDVLARFGGEEFTVVLADTRELPPEKVAERIRGTIETIEVPLDEDGTLSVTASIGISLDVDDIEVALKRADEALYEAKDAGRNRVRIWSG